MFLDDFPVWVLLTKLVQSLKEKKAVVLPLYVDKLLESKNVLAASLLGCEVEADFTVYCVCLLFLALDDLGVEVLLSIVESVIFEFRANGVSVFLPEVLLISKSLDYVVSCQVFNQAHELLRNIGDAFTFTDHADVILDRCLVRVVNTFALDTLGLFYLLEGVPNSLVAEGMDVAHRLYVRVRLNLHFQDLFCVFFLFLDLFCVFFRFLDLFCVFFQIQLNCHVEDHKALDFAWQKVLVHRLEFARFLKGVGALEIDVRYFQVGRIFFLDFPLKFI
jgi:hypothetical protein